MTVTKENIIIVGVIAVLIIVFSIVAAPPAVINDMQTNNGNTSGSSEPPAGQVAIADDVVGTGAEAVVGATVTVHYTGTFENGTKFDSSVDRGTPFSFVFGVGQVILGWDRGVQGMKVGGKRRLIVPSDLAYGSQGVKGPDGNYLIPPNATLRFEVELLDVKLSSSAK